MPNMERDFDFLASVYFQNKLYTNYYEFTIAFDVSTETISEQNVSLERIKYLTYELFENCAFINETEIDIISKLQDLGIRVCQTPDEPYDQIICLLLLLKINSICEGKIFVTDIKLTSKLSDGVKFFESYETVHRAIRKEGWWNENMPNLTSFGNMKKNKIVKLVKDSWNDLGLGWQSYKNNTDNVIYTKTNSENQNT